MLSCSTEVLWTAVSTAVPRERFISYYIQENQDMSYDGMFEFKRALGDALFGRDHPNA